ncbi:hypothetical protein NSMS1_10770 [Nostoc sp. MS1]|nr:hypothetical protein NSMS1_10770 [Nostoc sp. MS1]
MQVNQPKQRDKQPLDCYPLPSNQIIIGASISIMGLLGVAKMREWGEMTEMREWGETRERIIITVPLAFDYGLWTID